MPNLNGKKNNKIKTVFNIIMARYAILMIVILMIFVFFFAYKFIISPISASINGEIKAMNEDKEMQKSYSLKTLENIQKYKQDYKNVDEEDRKKINLMIPDEGGMEQLFSDIELLVLKNGFILNSLEIDEANKKESKKNKKLNSPSPPKENNVLGVIELKLDVSNSNYERFKKLLSAFESNLRLLDVSEINFSPEGSSLNFIIRTYYFKQDAKSKNG